MVGCESVAEMLAQAMQSEGQQLRHMANFCKSAGLLNALKNKDWAAFAKGYNGPQYAKNQYDIKLANAYQKALG